MNYSLGCYRFVSLSLMIVCGLSAADDTTRTAVFIQLDRNVDHRLSIDEFISGFKEPGKAIDAKKSSDLRAQFKRMDFDQNGTLTKDEYLRFFRNADKAVVSSSNNAAASTHVNPVPVAVAAQTPAQHASPEVHRAALPVVPIAPMTHQAPSATVDDDEKDVVDNNLSKNITLQPWTENQRRSVENTLLPAASTVTPGTFHYRILHVAREAWYEDTTTNLMGLDDSVKIGFLLGYGIAKNFDVNVQRTNGRTLQLNTVGKPVNMDYWDVLFKYKWCDQNDSHLDYGGLFDAALVLGGTELLRNHGGSDFSLDAQVVVERNFFNDRLRLGIGVAYAGLSVYESVSHLGPSLKLLPDEYAALTPAAKLSAGDAPHNGTVAIPISVKVAVSERWQLFGEAVFPKVGYRTGYGPAAVAGFRYNTHTHEYSFYVSNTANVSFNGVVSGGADHVTNLPFFGFSIVAHLP